MQRFFGELGIKQDKYLLHCDSQSVIHLAKNPSYNSKKKHFDVRHNFIHEVLNDGILKRNYTLQKIELIC